jgi:hypothetical protein
VLSSSSQGSCHEHSGVPIAPLPVRALALLQPCPLAWQKRLLVRGVLSFVVHPGPPAGAPAHQRLNLYLSIFKFNYKSVSLLFPAWFLLAFIPLETIIFVWPIL